MGEIIEFTRKKKEAFSVDAGSFVSVIAVDDIKDLASGKISIAEFVDPEKLTQTLALIILDYINVSDR